MKYVFHGKAEGWKFVADTPLLFRASFIELEGKRVTVTVTQQRKQRSVQENSFFHGVVLPLLSDASGYEIEEIKGIVKFIYGVKHTSEMSTVEFEKFMEWIRRWAITPQEQGGSGLNCYIPNPNEALPEYL